MKVDASSLPAFVRARLEANLGAANGKPLTWAVTMTPDRVDADGSAHVQVKFTNSSEAASAAAAVFAERNRFQGTLGADGRLLGDYDPNMQTTYDRHGESTSAQRENLNAQKVTQLFADFNTFAGGCAKRGHFKAGDAWRVESRDAFGIARDYDFAVAADASAGVQATVTMKGSFASTGSSSNLSASGHYDTARGLVVDFHEDTSFTNTPGTGPSSSGTSSNDFRLRS